MSRCFNESISSLVQLRKRNVCSLLAVIFILNFKEDE
nr:MAG TPA: hypothetical protein [Caudoviricetes sp.]